MQSFLDCSDALFALIFYFQFQKSGIYVKQRDGVLFSENNAKTFFGAEAIQIQ